MKTVINFKYENLTPSEIKEEWAYRIKQIEVDKSAANHSVLRIKFDDADKNEVRALAVQYQFVVAFSNDTGEDPYDALVEFEESTHSLKFTGNLVKVLQHLEGSLMTSAHIDEINNNKNAKAIVEQGRTWYVTWNGQLKQEHENIAPIDANKQDVKPAVILSNSPNSVFGENIKENKKRHRSELEVEELLCTMKF